MQPPEATKSDNADSNGGKVSSGHLYSALAKFKIQNSKIENRKSKIENRNSALVRIDRAAAVPCWLEV